MVLLSRYKGNNSKVHIKHVMSRTVNYFGTEDGYSQIPDITIVLI